MDPAEAAIAIAGVGRLRPMTDADLGMVLAWRNAPGVRAHMYTTHVISRDEHAAWWRRTRLDPSRRYFVFNGAAGPCGVVGFTGIDEAALQAEWAFYASSDAPRGTGSAMEVLALEYAFGVMGLDVLRCEVLASNARVIEMHTRFGFSTQGQEARTLADGREVIIYRLALDRGTWAGLREAALAWIIQRAETR